MVGETIKRDQTAWNIAMQHSQFTGNLVIAGLKAFLKGDLEEWFWNFNALREIINHDLLDKEVEELDALEQEIYSMFKFGMVRNKILFKQKTTQYQRKILKIMKKQGFFPSKEDRTRLSF